MEGKSLNLSDPKISLTQKNLIHALNATLYIDAIRIYHKMFE